MANPIGHLSHKEFNELTQMERVDVIIAYNDCNRYPYNSPCPEGILLKRFWDSWNYKGKGRYDDDIAYINRITRTHKIEG